MNTLDGSVASPQPLVQGTEDAQSVLKKALEDFLASNTSCVVGSDPVGTAETVLQSRDFSQILLKVSGTGGLDGPDPMKAPVREGSESVAAATVVFVGSSFVGSSDELPGDGDHLLGLCFALMISIMMSMIDASKKSQRNRYEEAHRVYELGLAAAEKVKEQSFILLSTAITGGVLGLSCAAAGLGSGLMSCKSSKAALQKRVEAHGLNDNTPATTGLTAVRRNSQVEGDNATPGEMGINYSDRKKELNFGADKDDVSASGRQALADSFRSGGTATTNLIQSTGESVVKKREADKQVMDSARDLRGVWLQDSSERQNKMMDIVHKAGQVATSVVEAQMRITQASNRG